VSNFVVTRILLSLLVVGTVAAQCFAQPCVPDSPVIDPRQSSVYIVVRGEGPGTPLSDDEPKQTMWLSLKNNTRWPILVNTFGLPGE
jgi:hypothetical protein